MAHELEFSSDRDRPDPYRTVEVRLHTESPSGRRTDADAFWDGACSWRARVRPDECGVWRWWTSSSDTTDDGLHAREGSFDCVPYERSNALYRRGPIEVAANGRHVAHADGTPFFWLGDTAWNGVVRATVPDWEDYLSARERMGFSAIQFFSTHWRGMETDPAGERAYTEDGGVVVNPGFFRRLDAKVEAINRHGMLASVIVVLALRDNEPAWTWAEADLVRFAKYLRARWGAYHMAWTLGGDGDFRGERAERWRRIGRAVYGPGDLVTMHPRGWVWNADEFRDEPWYRFITYQSGHTDALDDIRWHVGGPAPDEWRKPPARPIVNVEPNYEAHPAYASGIPFTDHDVRRAAYWSLLISPTAGVSYGHYDLWSWATEPEPIDPVIEDQAGYDLGPWWKGLDAPGARNMTMLRRYFESGPWWRLRPAPEILDREQEADDPRLFVAAAQAEDRSWSVVYAPVGGRISLVERCLPPGWSARWFDPRQGWWLPAQPSSGTSATFETPDGADWLLDLRSPTTSQRGISS